MTELTIADLPARFTTLITYGHSRLAFAAEHNSNLKPDAKVFQFSLDANTNELMRIKQVPMIEAFMPFNMKQGYRLHDNVMAKDLIGLMLEAIESANPKPKRVAAKRGFKLTARKPS